MKEIKTQPRDYQKEIFETAKDNNTLVVLPTGLGKTLIALMLSIDRMKKFPGSKILILAPTRPLVEQHLVSFQKQLPELWADMQLFTGSIPAPQRKKLFNQADIIFSTPQCIANDLKQQLYSLHDVSLLVIDEAHRCIKNYDYTKVVEVYKRQCVPERQRILGLTASPGSDSEVVKEICNHLAIEEIEVRTRDSKDVKQYLQDREFNKIEVPFPKEFQELKVLLERIWNSKVNDLKRRNLLFGPANKITLLKLQSRLAKVATGPDKFNAMFGMMLTAQAIKISHALELLETQTLSGVHEYLQSLAKQAEEKKSKGVQQLVKMDEFKAALVSLNALRSQKIEHPKIEESAVLVENEIRENPKAKFIIFTQFRETAARLVERLNQMEKVRAAGFFGQAKKGDTGMSQKEQKAVVQKLNDGELNVLVATSIGEEGLDIAEVSAVLFYEPIPSAIRKIQRAGRTARLAPGKLFILITQDTRDVTNHYASSAREKKMYKTIESVKDELKITKKTGSLKDFGV